MTKFTLICCVLISICSCWGDKTKTSQTAQAVTGEVDVPEFNADSAYSFIQQQVNFGPRVPNTLGHKQCGDYLIEKLESYGATVTTQEVELTAYTGTVLQARNIIGSFCPETKKRVLLFAHWDTRPWADSDPDEKNHYSPVPGANDGASGVGILLEIARQLQLNPTEVGIDIIFFDAEDYGIHNNDDDPNRTTEDNSWALGSQYWSRRPHVENYNARFGILLDLVGAPASHFYQEGISIRYATSIVNKVWEMAHAQGYAQFFPKKHGGYVTDDHLYVNRNMGIPSVNIINFDADSENGFGPYHHTLKDDMDWIDKSTLMAVGQTVMGVIYNEK